MNEGSRLPDRVRERSAADGGPGRVPPARAGSRRRALLAALALMLAVSAHSTAAPPPSSVTVSLSIPRRIRVSPFDWVTIPFGPTGSAKATTGATTKATAKAIAGTAAATSTSATGVDSLVIDVVSNKIGRAHV